MLFTEFLDSHVSAFQNTINSFEKLKLHLKNPQNIRVIRWGNNSHPSLNKRARCLATKFGIPVVLSDNEAACWMLNDAFKDLPLVSTDSIQNLLMNKALIIAHIGCKDDESDGNFGIAWPNWGWHGKTHKHIFDCKAPHLRKNLNDYSLEELNALMMRLMCPMNHFLFPKELKQMAERNCHPEFQWVAALYMKKRYPNHFDNFLDIVKEENEINWSEAERLYFTLQLPEYSTTVRTSVSNGMKIKKSAESNKMNLSGFGIAVVGENGDETYDVHLNLNDFVVSFEHLQGFHFCNVSLDGKDMQKNKYSMTEVALYDTDSRLIRFQKWPKLFQMLRESHNLGKSILSKKVDPISIQFKDDSKSRFIISFGNQ